MPQALFVCYKTVCYKNITLRAGSLYEKASCVEETCINVGLNALVEDVCPCNRMCFSDRFVVNLSLTCCPEVRGIVPCTSPAQPVTCVNML